MPKYLKVEKNYNLQKHPLFNVEVLVLLYSNNLSRDREREVPLKICTDTLKLIKSKFKSINFITFIIF